MSAQTPQAPPDAAHVARWGWGSLGVNVVLIALHGAVAWSSGSLAVTAELTHNGVDLAAAAAVLLGLKIASRKTRDFPYGLYKVENLVAVGISVLIIVTAYEIVHGALFGSLAPVRVEFWMLALLALTLAIPLVFSRFELRAAKAANSPALQADAREYRVHAYTTGLAFAALVAQRLELPLDRIAAAIIAIAVVKTGWDLLVDAIRVLLDASLDPASLDAARRAIAADPAVAEVTWVNGRNAGRFRFVEAGVVLRVPELAQAERVVRRIEQAVQAAVPQVERALLHIESRTSDRLRCAVPLAALPGEVSEHFGEAPFFAVVTLRRSDGAVLEQQVLSNPHRLLASAKGIAVAVWLTSQNVDLVLARRNLEGKGPSFVLHDAGIELRKIDAATLADALAAVAGDGSRRGLPLDPHP